MSCNSELNQQGYFSYEETNLSLQNGLELISYNVRKQRKSFPISNYNKI
jgi:hypothetical protein